MIVSCTQFEDDLCLLVDNEIEEQRKTALLQHMAACMPCKSSHERIKKVGGLLKQHSRQTVDSAPDIWAALSSKLPDVCEVVQEDLSAYLDGELIAPAKEGVDLHLKQCSPCLTKFQQLTKVNGLLSKGLKLPDNVEVDIWTGIKSRLNEDCLLIQSELSSFIDKEVAILRHRAITVHLTECQDCTQHFNQLNQTGDVLRSYYQPSGLDSLNLWPQISARLNVVPLEAKEKRRSVQAPRRLYAVAAAVVAGVVACSSYFYHVQSAAHQAQIVTAEAYLIDQSLGDPAEMVEPVAYERTD